MINICRSIQVRVSLSFFFRNQTQAYHVKDTPDYIKMSATDKLGVKLMFLCNPDTIL